MLGEHRDAIPPSRSASDKPGGDAPDEAVLGCRVEAGIAWLTLQRPQARNALSAGLMTALQSALDACATDPAVRVVVIGGAGSAFCAGHDLREIRANSSPEFYAALFAQCSRLMTGIVRLPKPVIARVHGVATAAGCQLVASCDLAVAASSARFATPGVNIGLFLLHADGRPVARNRAQGGHGDAADRGHVGCRTGAGARSGQPRGGRTRRSTRRSRRWRGRSPPRAR